MDVPPSRLCEPGPLDPAAAVVPALDSSILVYQHYAVHNTKVLKIILGVINGFWRENREIARKI